MLYKFKECKNGIKIGNNIKELLEQQGKSIYSLSQYIDMSYPNTHNLVNRTDLSNTKLETLLKVAKFLDVDIEELYGLERKLKGVNSKMLKEKYELKFEELKKEGKWAFFVVGSPTNLNHVEVAAGDTLQELWNELIDLDEIDVESYEAKNTIFNKEKEVYSIAEPSNYKEAIEEYLTSGNNFYYRKFSWEK